jgi:hypothetical protein
MEGDTQISGEPEAVQINNTQWNGCNVSRKLRDTIYDKKLETKGGYLIVSQQMH